MTIACFRARRWRPVENDGHFLPLYRPKEVLELIIRFAGS